jgi:hypothetical protein
MYKYEINIIKFGYDVPERNINWTMFEWTGILSKKDLRQHYMFVRY